MRRETLVTIDGTTHACEDGTAECDTHIRTLCAGHIRHTDGRQRRGHLSEMCNPCSVCLAVLARTAAGAKPGQEVPL